MRPHLITLACLCSALAAFVTAVPVPASNQELDVLQIPLSNGKELDVLTLGAQDQEQLIAERNKRTIGLLRDLFPELTQTIDGIVNRIIAQVIRVAGPDLLRSVLGNRSTTPRTNLDADFDDDDEDNEDVGAGSNNSIDNDKKSTTEANNRNSGVGGGDNTRIQIDLPTFPPETTEASNVSSTTLETRFSSDSTSPTTTTALTTTSTTTTTTTTDTPTTSTTPTSTDISTSSTTQTFTDNPTTSTTSISTDNPTTSTTSTSTDLPTTATTQTSTDVFTTSTTPTSTNIPNTTTNPATTDAPTTTTTSTTPSSPIYVVPQRTTRENSTPTTTTTTTTSINTESITSPTTTNTTPSISDDPQLAFKRNPQISDLILTNPLYTVPNTSAVDSLTAPLQNDLNTNSLNGATDTQIDLSAINKQLEETIRVARQVKEAEAAAAAAAGLQNGNQPIQLPIPSPKVEETIQLSFNNELASNDRPTKSISNELQLTESKSPAIDELTLDSNEDTADLDDRNKSNIFKRFLQFGGAGLAGGSSSGSSGASGAGGAGGAGSGNFLFDIVRLFSGSVQTQAGDESANSVSSSSVSDSDSDSQRGNDGYTEGIPGPVTRLVVLANRGLANLVQDLILRVAATSEKFVNFKAKLITALI